MHRRDLAAASPCPFGGVDHPVGDEVRPASPRRDAATGSRRRRRSGGRQARRGAGPAPACRRRSPTSPGAARATWRPRAVMPSPLAATRQDGFDGRSQAGRVARRDHARQAQRARKPAPRAARPRRGATPPRRPRRTGPRSVARRLATMPANTSPVPAVESQLLAGDAMAKRPSACGDQRVRALGDHDHPDALRELAGNVALARGAAHRKMRPARSIHPHAAWHQRRPTGWRAYRDAAAPAHRHRSPGGQAAGSPLPAVAARPVAAPETGADHAARRACVAPAPRGSDNQFQQAFRTRGASWVAASRSPRPPASRPRWRAGRRRASRRRPPQPARGCICARRRRAEPDAAGQVTPRRAQGTSPTPIGTAAARPSLPRPASSNAPASSAPSARREIVGRQPVVERRGRCRLSTPLGRSTATQLLVPMRRGLRSNSARSPASGRVSPLPNRQSTSTAPNGSSPVIAVPPPWAARALRAASVAGSVASTTVTGKPTSRSASAIT